MSSLLAWQDDHDDSDAGHVVVFARTQLQARAKVARERGMTLEESAVVRRPEFDAHAPGPVPASALLAAGWSLECGHCYHEVHWHGCDDCDPYAERMAEPVCEGEEAFCSAECREECIERRRDYQEGSARTWAEVLRRYPDAQRWSVWCDPTKGWAASFRLPGVICVLDWWANDPEHVTVALGDIPAVRELAGSEPEQRWESEGGPSFEREVAS